MELPNLLIAFGAGMVLFFSPCIAPVIPAYISSISGVGWRELEGRRGVDWRVMRNVLAFVLGFSALFIVMGLGLSALSGTLGLRAWVNRVGGALILVLALHMLELINIPLLNREFSAGAKVRARGLGGSLLMGAAFGFAWTPCTGPVLAAILARAAGGELAQSAGLMAGFSAGLAVPFIAAGAFTARMAGWIRRHGNALRWVNRATGVVLVVLAVLIFTGRLDGLLAQLFNALNLTQ